jgi:tetratricopeptide (TPR) repeat protein
MLTIFCLCLAIAVGPMGVTAPPVQASNIIEGRVVNKSGKGVSEAHVFLQNESYAQVGATMTDASGRFQFKSLPSGAYYIEVEPGVNNYERPQKQRVEAMAFNERQSNSVTRGGGEVFRVDIVLSAKKAEGALTDRTSSLVIFHQDVPNAAKLEFEQARKSLDKDEFESALRSLKKAVDLFPDYYDALELLGTEYVRRNDFNSAIPLLQHAIEINKDSWRGFYSLGIAQTSIKNYSEGLKSLKRAAELNPDSPNTNMRLGMVLAGDPQMRVPAIQALEKAIKLTKDPIPMAYLYLGGLYAKNEQYREAADAFKTLLRVEPNIGQRDQIEKLIAQYQQKAKEQPKK